MIQVDLIATSYVLLSYYRLVLACLRLLLSLSLFLKLAMSLMVVASRTASVVLVVEASAVLVEGENPSTAIYVCVGERVRESDREREQRARESVGGRGAKQSDLCPIGSPQVLEPQSLSHGFERKFHCVLG